jgi:ABC-2 type transport system permease protein
VLGYGVAATAFAGLAIVTVIRRESAILKRLRGTPLPSWTYLTSSLGSTILVFAIEAVVLIVLAKLLFDVPFPTKIFSLVLALLLGSIAFAGMGLALTTVIRSAEGSSAVVNAIYLPMAFIAGSFLARSTRTRASRGDRGRPAADLLHPLRARASSSATEQIWDEPAVARVAAWGARGPLAVRGFRWEHPRGLGPGPGRRSHELRDACHRVRAE